MTNALDLERPIIGFRYPLDVHPEDRYEGHKKYRFGFGIRSWNIFDQEEIYHIWQLTQILPSATWQEKMLSLKGFGRGSLREVFNFLVNELELTPIYPET